MGEEKVSEYEKLAERVESADVETGAVDVEIPDDSSVESIEDESTEDEDEETNL